MGNRIWGRGPARAAAGLAPLMLLAAGAAASASAPAGGQPSPQTIAVLRQLTAAVGRKDCKSVLKLGEPLLARGRNDLPSEIETATFELVASCAYSEGAKQKAYEYAVRGTRLEGSGDDLWHLRLWLEIDAKRYDAAVATVDEMSQGRGAALNSVPQPWFGELQRKLKEAGQTAQRKRLLQLLAADSYAPDDSYGDAQGLHYQYALLLAQEGNAEGARAVLRGLKDPSLLTDAMFEPRLQPLLPANLDLRAAAEAQLAFERDAAALHADRLAPIIDAAADLRRLGRAQEALTLLQSVEGQVGDAAAFKDHDRKLPWYWDAQGRTYEALARYDDAVAAYRRGIAAGEGRGLNVSQTINLAYAQIRFGHGEDALKTLAGFEDPKRDASPYGLMEMHFARGCAQAATGHPAAAAPDLAFAQAHEKDDSSALTDLYLCLGRMDEAAAAMIRRLDDPERRAAALDQLSDYEALPAGVPPQPFERPLKALKARPDVRAAIDRAGGTRHFPLQRGDL